MAVINLNIGNVVEDCPNITIPDMSDYASANAFLFTDFRFHDYGGGLPAVNTTFTFSDFKWGTVDFTGVSIQVQTDGAGNIINPEIQYRALANALNEQSTPQIDVEFVMPADTNYRDWYIRVSSDTDTGLVNQALDTTVSGGSITPVRTTSAAQSETISVRNLTLLDKDENPIDLGAVAQVDQLILSGSYTIGQTFTLNFCGDVVTYTVEDGETTAECVAAGIEAAVIAKTGGLFERYASVARDRAEITFTSKEAGVPLNIEVSYNGTESFDSNTVTANVPSMAIPSYTNSDEVVYETAERGGLYTAILTVVSECDYNRATREFFSWCFDLAHFDCCFVDLMTSNNCCCKKAGKIKEASALRNIITATPIMIRKGESESKIQRVIDMGWSICQPLECGCPTC